MIKRFEILKGLTNVLHVRPQGKKSMVAVTAKFHFGIIEKERSKYFLENYRNPEEFCCLFVMDEDFTNYVYIPFPIDDD